MAMDAFLYFTSSIDQTKVPGESNDEYFKDKKAFELVSFTMGAENEIKIGSHSGGGGGGKSSFKPFNFTKRTDTASAGLLQQLCVGRHFEECIIELRRSGGAGDKSGATFMKFSLKHVLVSDIEWSGSEDDLEESVTVEYGAMKAEYIPQKPDGTMDTSNTKMAEWSRMKNSAIYAV